MRKFFLVLFLLLPDYTAHAQTRIVQTSVCRTTTAVLTVYICQIAPTTAGDLLVFYGNLPNNPPEVSDTQGNLWQQANTDLKDVSASHGGPETITFEYAAPGYLNIVIAEFSGTWILSKRVHNRNFPIYGGQSLRYVDNTSTPASFPLTTTVPGELVIGYGDSDELFPPALPLVTPEPGWTLVGQTPNRYMQFTVQQNPGTITSYVTQSFIPEGTYSTAGIVAFRACH
jgi:hypothetical protein